MAWQRAQVGVEDGHARALPRADATAVRWHVPALLMLGILFLVPWYADRPMHGDAAMYAAIAKTVLATGDPIRLTLNGRPYANKPPLFFWLAALADRVLGASAFAAMLVSGLLGIANVLLLYAICRDMGFDSASAFAAAVAYVTTPEVVHWTRGVHLESLLTLWLLVGIFAAYRSVRRERAILLLGLAAAGGWMSKGPQGLFALPVAPLLWWRDGVLRARLLSRWTLGALLIAVAVVGPWTWARIAADADFADVYFRGQVAGALVTEHATRRGTLWYFAKLAETYWPWLPFALAGVVLLARRARADLAARTWLAFGTVVLAATMATAMRRPRYLMPLYPALAVASGVALGVLAQRVRRLLPALTACALGAAVLLGFADSERSSAASDRMRGDAIAIARALPAGGEIWLAGDVPQEGMPGLGKVLGLYATPLLCSCGYGCAAPRDAAGELRIVTLAATADVLAQRIGAVAEQRNATLAVLRVPAAARAAALEQACALETIVPPW